MEVQARHTAFIQLQAKERNQEFNLTLSLAFVGLLLTIFVVAKPAFSQSNSQIGLPVLFVHGFCDTADSFSAAEIAVKNSLETQYPTLYPTLSSLPNPVPEEYVAFYNGSNVQFQIPGSTNTSKTTTTVIDSRTRFFLVEFNDGVPADSLYQELYQNAALVAQISILNKAQELAHIIWAIKVATGAPRVIVVSHSLGGLVARAYIENLSISASSSDAPAAYFNDIASLVTLDTPHGGATEASWSIASYATGMDQCAFQTSINKTEMTPTGSGSLIPRINYGDPSSSLQPTPLPVALNITSITSHWLTGNDGVLLPPIPFLTISQQDLKSSLGKNVGSALSTLNSVDNLFIVPFYGTASLTVMCGWELEFLHFLGCTGDSSQTFGEIISAIATPFPPVANSSLMQVSPASWNVAVAGTASFSAKTPSGASPIWSILEGGDGGTITSGGLYRALANISGATETFHVVAIDSQYWTEYAEASVTVIADAGTGIANTLSATGITSSGAKLGGTIKSEGSPGYASLILSTNGTNLTRNTAQYSSGWGTVAPTLQRRTLPMCSPGWRVEPIITIESFIKTAPTEPTLMGASSASPRHDD